MTEDPASLFCTAKYNADPAEKFQKRDVAYSAAWLLILRVINVSSEH